MKVVFLDRDGVINRKIEKGYVLDWNDFEFLPDVAKAIHLINEKGYKVMVMTNQPCVHKGLISDEKLASIHEKMKKELRDKGAIIDDIFVCPHTVEENCDCRKPKIGLFNQAKAKYPDISFKDSWFIGDSDSDVEAGEKAGVKAIQICPEDDLLKIIEKDIT